MGGGCSGVDDRCVLTLLSGLKLCTRHFILEGKEPEPLLINHEVPPVEQQ